MALIASQGLASWLARKDLGSNHVCPLDLQVTRQTNPGLGLPRLQRMDGSRWQPAFAILSLFIFPLSLVIIPMDFTVQLFAYTYGLSLIVSIILAVILSTPFGNTVWI